MARLFEGWEDNNFLTQSRCEICEADMDDMDDIEQDLVLLESSMENIKFEPVQEVYIGKTPLLKAAESEFDKILKKYRANRLYNVANSAEIKNIEKIMKEQFGLHSCGICLADYTPLNGKDPMYMPNAFAVTSSILTTATHKDSYRLSSEKGYYDVDHIIDVQVIMAKSLLTYPWVTGAHLMAIFLHELGHCFDSGFWLVCSSLARVDFNPMSIATQELFRMLRIAEANVKVGKFIESSELIRLFMLGYTTTKRLTTPVTSLVKNMKLISKVLSGKALVVHNMERYMMQAVFSYAGASGEMKSDQTAAMYGYGKEINEFNWKGRELDLTPDTLSKKMGKAEAPITIVWDFAQVCNKIGTTVVFPDSLLDEHPSDSARMKVVIKKLKRDLKNCDYSPEVKENLLRDIENAEKTYEKYLSLKTDDDKFKVFSKLQRNILNLLTRGYDWRTIGRNEYI